jgi:hypothetical protein
MVYNQSPQGEIDVRLATGNILPEDYPDTEIAKKIKSAYSKIQLGVRRELNDPFTDDDVAKEHCVQLEITIAAMYCLKAYGAEFEDKIVELRTEAKEDMTFMQEALGITVEIPVVEEEGDIEGTIAGLPAKGWYKNPQVMIPNKMKAYKSPSDIEGLGVPRLDPESDLS